MRSGLIFNLLEAAGTFAVVTGTEDSDYPVANLADAYDPGEVARIAPDTGSVVLTYVLDADTDVQALALAEHNIPDGGEVQVELFDDAGLTSLVHDTGAVAVPTPTADPQSFPVVLDAPATVRSIRLTVTGLADDLEIGALAVGDWFELLINSGLEAALEVGGSEQVLAGGGSYGAEGEAFRTRAFQVSYMDLATSTTTGLDFQKLQGLTRPCVYVEDYDTPASWPADCFLCANSDLPLMTSTLFDRDQVQFRLREAR